MTKRHGHLAGGFVSLPHRVLDGDAWRDLSGNAAKLLDALCRRFNGRNNGEISLSKSQAAKSIGVSERTAIRLFAELKAAGFVEEARRGGMRYRENGERVGVASTWRINFYPEGTRGDATKP